MTKFKHLLVPLAVVLATAVASDDHLRGSAGHRAINEYENYLLAKYPDFDEAGYEPGMEPPSTSSGEDGVAEDGVAKDEVAKDEVEKDKCNNIHSGMRKEEGVADVGVTIDEMEKLVDDGKMGIAQMYDYVVAVKLPCMKKKYKNDKMVSDLEAKYKKAKDKLAVKLQVKAPVSFQQEEENSGKEPLTEDEDEKTEDEVEETKEVEDLDQNEKIVEALLEVGFDPKEIEKVIAKVESAKEDEAIELNEEEKAELKEDEVEFRQ